MRFLSVVVLAHALKELCLVACLLAFCRKTVLRSLLQQSCAFARAISVSSHFSAHCPGPKCESYLRPFLQVRLYCESSLIFFFALVEVVDAVLAGVDLFVSEYAHSPAVVAL